MDSVLLLSLVVVVISAATQVDSAIVNDGAVCPCKFTAWDGDVPGQGLTGGYTASLLQCADDCTARLDCNGFEHSDTNNECKLVTQKVPTAAKYQDFQFCSKIEYFKAAGGENCPTNQRVTTVDDCKVAATQIGFPFRNEVSDTGDYPAGCNWDARGGTYFNNILVDTNFNTVTKGGICKQSAVDCVWGSFSEWTDCSASCAPGGKKTRTRTIVTPASSCGAACTGDATETKTCKTQACPGVPVWDKARCGNWKFPLLLRYTHNPGHGDVCRHKDWPRNRNWRCPNGCVKVKRGRKVKAPFCKIRGKWGSVCRV